MLLVVHFYVNLSYLIFDNKSFKVHNRESYLRQLIASLSAARHIEKTLLVFSHDVWDEQINTLVRYYDDDTLDDKMSIFLPGLNRCYDNAID